MFIKIYIKFKSLKTQIELNVHAREVELASHCSAIYIYIYNPLTLIAVSPHKPKNSVTTLN